MPVAKETHEFAITSQSIEKIDYLLIIVNMYLKKYLLQFHQITKLKM